MDIVYLLFRNVIWIGKIWITKVEGYEVRSLIINDICIFEHTHLS
jgi:hypothetical protein